MSLGVASQRRFRELVYALTKHFRAAGVTPLMTMEVAELLGNAQLTGHGVSSIVDNLIVLRYVEVDGHLERAVFVLKARGTSHAADLRRFRDRRPRGARRRAVPGSARGSDGDPSAGAPSGASGRATPVGEEEAQTMSSLFSNRSSSVGSVARTLYDIAQGFDSPLDTEPRLRRALKLLRRIVPYHQCALLEAAAGESRLVVEPDSREERESLSPVLARFLTVLTDDAKRGADSGSQNVGPPRALGRALAPGGPHRRARPRAGRAFCPRRKARRLH